MSSDEESDSRETEGEKALKRRREQTEESAGLDDAARELLQQNRVERNQMMNEIQELRERSERRKKEREIEEKRLTAERSAEEARRKADEEERKRKKEEEELKKHRERMLKMAEFEKWKIPPKANFFISRKLAVASGEEADGEQAEGKGRKSKEQLEAEKQAILKQRIRSLDIDGADAARLTDRLKELHTLITRLEGEKYDIEKRYKTMQSQLQQLAELARQANKVGRDGLKRIQTGTEDSVDKIQQRFAGAPSKVEMFSKYERQKDKRTYEDRKVLYTGPQFLSPPERIKPNKIVTWNEEGIPIYSDGEGQPRAEGHGDEGQHVEAAPVEAAE